MKKNCSNFIVNNLDNACLVTGVKRWKRKPEKPSQEEKIKQATKELDLTNEQVAKWIEIHKK